MLENLGFGPDERVSVPVIGFDELISMRTLSCVTDVKDAPCRDFPSGEAIVVDKTNDMLTLGWRD